MLLCHDRYGRTDHPAVNRWHQLIAFGGRDKGGVGDTNCPCSSTMRNSTSPCTAPTAALVSGIIL